MKKIGIYLRVSTLEQDQRLQLRDIESILPKGTEKEFYSEQKSAWKENVKRPEFERMKSDIMNGKLSDVYCWDLDRLYRNRIRLKDFFVLCKIKGVKIHSFRQQWLESINTIQPPFGDIMQELLINIFGYIGQEESDKKSERIKLAQKETEDGIYSVYGNKWGRKGVTPQCITKVLQLHSEGLSIRKICAQVYVYDKNNNAKNISIGAVHKILHENRHEKQSI